MSKNRKIIYSFIGILLIFVFCLNLNNTNGINIKRSMATQCINIANNLQSKNLFKISNYFYSISQNLYSKTQWIDYNIAKNIRSEYWNKPLTERKKEKLQIALKHLDIENVKHQNNVIILSEYAYTYDQLEEFDKAIEYYEKITKIDSKWEYGLQRLSHLYCNIKFDYPKALDYINRKMELNIDKGYYGDYFGKAYILQQMENYNEAIKYYKKYIENNKTHVAGFVNIAICELELGKYDDAEKYVNEGLKYAPNFSYLINSKIRILKYKHKFDEAQRSANELIERDKYDYAAYLQLAEIYRYQNNKIKSEEYYNMARDNAKEFYDAFCENPYDIGDLDGHCGNRYKFLKDFEKEKSKPLEF